MIIVCDEKGFAHLLSVIAGKEVTALINAGRWSAFHRVLAEP